jgi:hypothetical protein
MPRHDAPSRTDAHRTRRDPDYEKWRDEQARRLGEERDDLRPDAGPPEEGEQPQSPGAKPLHRTQQQQH